MGLKAVFVLRNRLFCIPDIEMLTKPKVDVYKVKQLWWQKSPVFAHDVTSPPVYTAVYCAFRVLKLHNLVVGQPALSTNVNFSVVNVPDFLFASNCILPGGIPGHNWNALLPLPRICDLTPSPGHARTRKFSRGGAESRQMRVHITHRRSPSILHQGPLYPTCL